MNKRYSNSKRDHSSDSDSHDKKYLSKKKHERDSSESESERKYHSKRDKSSDDDGDKGKSELFVKNLNYDTNEGGLKEFFEKYGSIRRTNILKRDDGKSKGIGFVSFENASDAQAAMNDAENLELDGRKITINWALEKKREGGYRERDRSDRDRGDKSNDDGGERKKFSSSSGTDGAFTAFIGNLGFRTSESMIKNFFKDCGKVTNVRIAKRDDGKSKGFCHVDFDTKEALESAIQKNGQELDGRQLRVDESQPISHSGDRRGGRGRGRGGFRGGRDRRRDDDDY